MEPRLSTTLLAGPRSSTTARTKVTPRSSSAVVSMVNKREPKSYAEQFRIQTILREQTVPGFPPRKNIGKNKKIPPTKTNKLSTSISASNTINHSMNVTQLNSTKLKVPNQFKNQIKNQNQSQLQLTLKSKLSAAAAAADRDPNRSRFSKLPNFNHGKRDRQVKGEGQPPPAPSAKETKGKSKKCALCEKHSAGSIEDGNDSDDAALRNVPTRTLLTSQFGQDDLPDADSYTPVGPGPGQQRQQQHQPESEREPAQNGTRTRTSGSENHEMQENANLTSNSNNIQNNNQQNMVLTRSNAVTTIVADTSMTNTDTNGINVDENNNYIPNETEDIRPTPPQFQIENVHNNLQRERHNSSQLESEVLVKNKNGSHPGPVIQGSSGISNRRLNSITCEAANKVDLPLKNSSKANLNENAMVKAEKLQHSSKKSKQATSASGTTGKHVIKETSTKRPVGGLKNTRNSQESSVTSTTEKNSMSKPFKSIDAISVKPVETEITKVTEKIPDQFTHQEGKIGDKKELKSPILPATTSLAGVETNQVKNTHDEVEANSSPKHETKSDSGKLNPSLTNLTDADTDADNIKILAQIEHEKLLLTKNNKNKRVLSSTEKQAEKEVKKCSGSSNSTAKKSLSNLETKNNINTADNKRRTSKKTEEEVEEAAARSRSQSGSRSRSASQNKSDTRSQSKLVAQKKENDKSNKITTTAKSSPKCEMKMKDTRTGPGARAGAGVGDTGKENQNPGVKTLPSKVNRRNAPTPIRRLLLPLSTEKVQPNMENFNVQETPKYLLNKLEEGIFQVPSTENLSESDKAQEGGHINLSKIVLLYPEGNGMTGFMRLTNPSPQVIFYRIFPCTPDRYSIEPKEGKLEPNKAILIKLGTEEFMKEKDFEDDKFKIETVLTSADASSHTASRRFWMNVPLSRIQTTYTTSVHLYDPNDSFFQKYWKYSRSATSNSKFAINLERSSSTSKTGLSLLRFMDVTEVVEDLKTAQQDLQSIRGRENFNVILAVLILSVGFWAIFNRLQIIPGLESVIKGKR